MKENPQTRKIIEYLGQIEFLKALYPNENWILGNFKYAPKGVWNDPAETRKFLESIGEKLKIRESNDWYRVSRSQVLEEVTDCSSS